MNFFIITVLCMTVVVSTNCLLSNRGIKYIYLNLYQDHQRIPSSTSTCCCHTRTLYNNVPNRQVCNLFSLHFFNITVIALMMQLERSLELDSQTQPNFSAYFRLQLILHQELEQLFLVGSFLVLLAMQLENNSYVALLKSLRIKMFIEQK